MAFRKHQYSLKIRSDKQLFLAYLPVNFKGGMISLKGLQSIIRKYLKDHEKHKKYIALIMALSAIVTFAVPMSLIMPAISMTNGDDS